MIAGLSGVALGAALLVQGPLDSTFAALRNGPAIPAIAIAVVHRGQVVYRNVAGTADFERAVPATLDTRFDWASIAKQFTAFSVSKLIDEARVAAVDPVTRYLPGLDLGGSVVTIDQLLHHTAGIEDVDGLLALAGGLPGDPVTLDALVGLLTRQQHLRFAPGERHFYSNGGYVLLARIVETLTGMGFAAWTDSAVFRPLGMARSGFLSRPEQLVPGRAMPYVRSRSGSPFIRSTQDTYPGAGGLFATVGDMATWITHLLEPRRDRAATLRLRERGRLTSGETLDYAWGLAWGTYRGRATLMHGGSGPATEAQLLLIPELEFGVVVAAAGPTGVNPSTLAFRAADALLGSALGPADSARGPRMLMLTEEMVNRRPPETEGVTPPEGALRDYAGTYRFDDQTTIVVRASNGHLAFEYGGRGMSIPMFPLPDGRFVTVPLWDAYRFVTDGAGRVTGMVRERTPRSLRRGGPEQVTATRLPDPAPFTPETAAPYIGWYYGEEVDAFYQVVLEDGALVLRHPRHGRRRLTPLGPGEYTPVPGPLAAVRFDRQGTVVTGMELEAVSWGVRSAFRKLKEGP